MRHASRTHIVALDWLFDRINLDPKIQIKYVVDTKNQLPDILTEGSFTRDVQHYEQFNDFLQRFQPINDPRAMSKRQMHEGKQGG